MRPELVVGFGMTRAIETAAIAFGALLTSGEARFAIRPEIRELWLENIGNCARSRRWVVGTLCSARSRSRPRLTGEDMGGAGRRQGVAGAGALRVRRADGGVSAVVVRAGGKRLLVSHKGAINNLPNREPWADARRRFGFGCDWFPGELVENLAEMFALPNAGWVALEYEYQLL